MEHEVYTKRADLPYRKMAYALNQEVPLADISWNRCWEVFCDVGNLAGSLETSEKTGITEFDLYRGDDVVKTFSWKNNDIFSNGDWDWGKIYKEVVPYIIDKKLIKKPRMKRKDAGKPKPKKIESAKSIDKSNKTGENLRDQLLADKDIESLFKPQKNANSCNLTKVEIQRWRNKQFSVRLSMYEKYKNHLPYDEYMLQYINITKTMRNLGINTYITSDWIKDYFGILK